MPISEGGLAVTELATRTRAVENCALNDGGESRQTARPPLRHIAALDGLRGVAILLVLFKHAFELLGNSTQPILKTIETFSGVGWIGVDLFFVLSGYLITSILLNSKDSEGYFRNFYSRRALRIFPAYYACLVVVLLIVPHLPSRVGSALDLSRGTTGQSWLWLYGTNVKITLNRDWYFGALDPFWSLSVEEHFYLVWPALVFLMSPRSLRRVCGWLILIAPALRVAMILKGNITGAYVFTLCRMDSLAWGALAALFTYDQCTRAMALIRGKWIFALVLFACVAFWPVAGPWQTKTELSLGFSLLGFAFCGAVLTAANRPSRFLENRLLRSFGIYSYGIYIWEAKLTWGLFPFLAKSKYGAVIFASHSLGRLGLSLAAIASAYAIGWLSYHVVEKPFLLLKRHFEYDPPQKGLRIERELSTIGVPLQRSWHAEQADSHDRRGLLGRLRGDGSVPGATGGGAYRGSGLPGEKIGGPDQDGRA